MTTTNKNFVVKNGITAGGKINTDDATDASTTTDGSLQTDGGLSVVKKSVFGDQITVPDGAAATPGIRFTTAAHGFYYEGSTTMAFAIAGVKAGAFAGPDGSTSGGGLQLRTPSAGERAIVYTSNTNSYVIFTANSGDSAGGQLRIYGSTHATKPNYFEITNGSTVIAYSNGTNLLVPKRILVSDTTDATSVSNGSMQTDGGLSVTKKGFFGDSVTVSTTGTASNLVLSAPSGYASNIYLRSNGVTGSNGLQLESDSSNVAYVWNFSNTSLILGVNNATALTIAASKDATFVGTVFTPKLYLGASATYGGATYGGDINIMDGSQSGPENNIGINFVSSASGNGYGTKIYTNNSNDTFYIATRYNSATWTNQVGISEQTGDVSILSTTASTATNVGALKVGGGLGVIGQVNASSFQVDGLAVIDTATLTTTSISQVALALVAGATYRSVKFQIQGVDATGTKYHTTEIIAIHNGTTAQSSEYGSINIGGVTATFAVDYSGGNLRLLVTPASTNSTVFKVVMSLINV